MFIKAKQRFRKLGLTNVSANLSDGCFGWEKQAPYDGIITTAAPQAIPEDLLSQLAPNGLLVIPEFDEIAVEKVKFVPLLSGLSR